MSDAPFRTRFRQAREAKHLTQAAVADALKISQSAVAQWESSRSVPSAGLAARIKELLGVEIRSAEASQPPRVRKPLRQAHLPIVGLPAPGDEERIIVDGSTRGEIPAPPQLENVPGAKAAYVRGVLMEPRYYQGELIYLHPNRPPNPGDFVFVTVKEAGYPADIGYIRQYLGEDLGHVHFGTLNPKKRYRIARQNLVGMATIVGSSRF